MWNFNDVKSIRHISNYVFRIVFDDGMEGEVDFSEYLDKGPVFEPLMDEAFFRRARVENGTISWPNGAYIAPETLYEKVEISRKRLQRTA